MRRAMRIAIQGISLSASAARTRALSTQRPQSMLLSSLARPAAAVSETRHLTAAPLRQSPPYYSSGRRTGHDARLFGSSSDGTTMTTPTGREEKMMQDMLFRIRMENNVPLHVRENLVEFVVDGKKLGKSSPKVADLLCTTIVDGEAIFQLVPGGGSSQSLTLTAAAGDTCQSRTDAVMLVMEQLRDDGRVGFLSGWRDENYPVAESFYDEPLLLVERAATPLLGTQDYGVHINGLVRDGPKDRDVRMWMARRSQTKSKYPGMLDHIVAGGQPAGMNLIDNVVKECEEEAGIPASLTRELVRPAGAVSYECFIRTKGSSSVVDGVISRAVLFCYDMELPKDFEPRVVDGEVEEFFLWTIDEVKESMDPKFDDPIKPNCYPVIIDYLLRAGHIEPDAPGYLDVLRELRSGYCG